MFYFQFWFKNNDRTRCFFKGQLLDHYATLVQSVGYGGGATVLCIQKAGLGSMVKGKELYQQHCLYSWYHRSRRVSAIWYTRLGVLRRSLSLQVCQSSPGSQCLMFSDYLETGSCSVFIDRSLESCHWQIDPNYLMEPKKSCYRNTLEDEKCRDGLTIVKKVLWMDAVMHLGMKTDSKECRVETCLLADDLVEDGNEEMLEHGLAEALMPEFRELLEEIFARQKHCAELYSHRCL